MIHRDHSKLIAETLRCMVTGACRPTHIMYKVMLSYPQLQQILVELEEKKLAFKTSMGYVMTAKGLQVMEQYDRLVEVMN